MTRLPVVSGKQVVKGLSKIGYEFDHQRGSHIVLEQKTEPYRRVTIRDHNENRKGHSAEDPSRDGSNGRGICPPPLDVELLPAQKHVGATLRGGRGYGWYRDLEQALSVDRFLPRPPAVPPRTGGHRYRYRSPGGHTGPRLRRGV